MSAGSERFRHGSNRRLARTVCSRICASLVSQSGFIGQSLMGSLSVSLLSAKTPGACRPPKGPKRRICYIPFIGIQKKFWGEPKDSDDKYSSQILDDVI